MKTFIFISALLFTFSAFASNVVKTPFQIVATQGDIETLIDQNLNAKALKGDVPINVLDKTITDPFQVKISGISVQLKYEIKKPVRSPEESLWRVQSEKLSAELMVKKIDASQTIEIIVDGKKSIIHLNGYCSDVKLSLPEGKTHINGAAKLNYSTGKPEAELVNFEANWEPGSWQIVSMNCQGPRGFDKVISKAAEQNLREINPFLDEIRTEIKNQLKGLFLSPLNLDFVVGKSSPISVKMNTSKFEVMGKNLLVSGSTSIQFLGLSKESNCGTEVLNLTGNAKKSNFRRITLPMQAIKSVIACMQASNQFQFSFLSNEISAFKELQTQWIEKALVWPDLLNFSNDAIFGFNLEITGAPEISEERYHNKGMLFNLHAPMRMRMDATKEEELIPYMYFRTDLDGPVKLEIEKNTIRLLFSENFPLAIKAYFDREYVSKYKTNTSMWWTKIEDTLQNYLSTTGLELKIPDFEIFEGSTLRLNGGRLNDENYDFGFIVEKKQKL